MKTIVPLQESYTSGELAEFLGVCRRTVAKWCDRGELHAWTLPLTNIRRINVDDLRTFLAKCNLPFAVATPRIVVATPTEGRSFALATNVKSRLPAFDVVGLFAWDNLFEQLAVPIAGIALDAGTSSFAECLDLLSHSDIVARCLIVGDDTEPLHLDRSDGIRVFRECQHSEIAPWLIAQVKPPLGPSPRTPRKNAREPSAESWSAAPGPRRSSPTGSRPRRSAPP